MTNTLPHSTSRADTGWRLTGGHVLGLLIGFFGIIITTSIIFTVLAVQSFRGEDVKKSYRQGLNYNATLAQRAEQAELGWQAAVNVIGTREARVLLVQINTTSEPVSDVSFSGRLRHPVDMSLDRPLTFTLAGDGVARADLSGLIGQWTLEAEGQQGDKTFAFRKDLDLR